MTERTRLVAALVCLVAAAALISSCAPGGTDDSPPGSDLSTSVGVPSVGGDWDLTYEDLLALREEQLPGLAEQHMVADPPPVQLVRFTTTTEWPLAMVDCLANEGFAARVTQGGVAPIDLAQEQAAAYNLATYVCSARYYIDPRTQLPLPRVRAELQYRYWADVVADCVRSLDLDPGQPPSLEVWLDQYYVNPPPWDPFTEAGSTEAALNRIYEECPRDAPELYPPVE